MSKTTKPVTSPTVPSPKTSAAAPIPTSAFSINQPDLEAQPSSPTDEKRVRKPKPKSSSSAGAILGVLFVLLLLAAGGAGGYYYYITYMNPPKLPSAIKSISSKSSTSVAPPPPEPSVMSVMRTDPLRGAQLALEKHPRSLAVTVFAVILTIALIATVAVLMKTANAPPQVVEKDIYVQPPPPETSFASFAQDYFGWSPVALGAAIGGVVLVVLVLLIGIPVAVWKKKGAAPPRAPHTEYHSVFVTGSLAEKKAIITQLYNEILGMVEVDPAANNLIFTVNPPHSPSPLVPTPPAAPPALGNPPGNTSVVTHAEYIANNRPLDYYMQPQNNFRKWEYYFGLLQGRTTLSFSGQPFMLSIQPRARDRRYSNDEVIDHTDVIFDIICFDDTVIAANSFSEAFTNNTLADLLNIRANISKHLAATQGGAGSTSKGCLSFK